MGHFDQLPENETEGSPIVDKKESKEELKSPEANALDFLIATFTGRIAADEHLNGRDAQPAVDKWIAENAHKFNDAFDEMRKDRPDLINDTSYANQEASIKFIEKRLKE